MCVYVPYNIPIRVYIYTLNLIENVTTLMVYIYLNRHHFTKCNSLVMINFIANFHEYMNNTNTNVMHERACCTIDIIMQIAWTASLYTNFLSINPQPYVYDWIV